MVQKQLFHRLGVAFILEVSASKGKRARKESLWGRGARSGLLLRSENPVVGIFIFLGVPHPALAAFNPRGSDHADISWCSESCGVHPPPPPHPAQLLESIVEIGVFMFPVSSLEKNLIPWMLTHTLLTSCQLRNYSDRIPNEGLSFPHAKHPTQVKAPKYIQVLSLLVYKSD